MNDDLKHLRVLSAFHYVVAVLAGLFSLLPLIHLVIGLSLATGQISRAPLPPPARIVGALIAAFAVLFILCGLTFAVCLALAGANLANQRRYTFCLVMAGVACIFMPFGTVLGVLTIIVLSRDSVKQLFDRRAAA